ncbi:single-stranded DNA-binding protein [Phocaeicola dorei]|nr:single-stranded DNA-binding protein [Phocaeicola dorei]
MKKVVENSFAVTGFVGKDAEIRQFTTASVARFPLAVSRKEQNGEEYVSSFIYVEAWRKNDSTSFELLKKGKNITVKGFFKPDEWTDQQGVKHNRIIMAVTDFYELNGERRRKSSCRFKKKKAKKAA